LLQQGWARRVELTDNERSEVAAKEIKTNIIWKIFHLFDSKVTPACKPIARQFS